MRFRYRFDALEDELLDVLGLRTRAATDWQLLSLPAASTKSPQAMKRRLRRLRAFGLIERARLALRVPEVEGPLEIWPGYGPQPDYWALVWKLERRWKLLRPRRVTVYWATRRAAKLLGGAGGRIARPSQLEHDLGATSSYIARLGLQPDTATGWVGEDLLRRRLSRHLLRRMPDAAIVDQDGLIQMMIEFGGQHYSANKLRAWHRHCCRFHLQYELW